MSVENTTYLVSPCRTVKSKLDSLPIVNGQWIIVTDTLEQYMDISDTERIPIQEIILLSKESDRLDLLTPLNKLYFVMETGILWMYNSGWITMSVTSSNVSYTPPSGVSSELKTVKLALDALFEQDVKYEGTLTDGSVAVFSGTAGKVKSSRIKVTTNGVIQNVATPIEDTDAANKKYVDEAVKVNLNAALIYTVLISAQSDNVKLVMDSKGTDSLFTDAAKVTYGGETS